MRHARARAAEAVETHAESCQFGKSLVVQGGAQASTSPAGAEQASSADSVEDRPICHTPPLSLQVPQLHHHAGRGGRAASDLKAHVCVCVCVCALLTEGHQTGGALLLFLQGRKE